jgi:hypothetical protein
MPAPQLGDKVRFKYTLPENTRPTVLEGKILQFIVRSQKAVIEVKIVGVVTVPIGDIIRVL